MLSSSPLRFRLFLVPLLALAACADGEVSEPEPSPVEVDVVSNEDSVGVAAPTLDVTADTTGPARVEVAGESVPTRAVATQMESGDRACYLTLREDSGTLTTVFADYSVCDSDGILNRRVQIEYVADEVIAESCEGAPDCLDTETVALAVTASPID